MNYTPEQIASIVLKVLKEIETPDVSSLPFEEKIELAQNPNTPQETLQVLATDEHPYVRRGVAHNPNTPQETLKVLATDEDYCVRYWVAKNPNYKKQTLELTSTQHEALKKLIESGQDESLKGLMDT
jgi:3-methyladenine DNA glycosylase AlkC